MIKRVADARMHPWEAGKAVQEAESASAQTRRESSSLWTWTDQRASFRILQVFQFLNIFCSTHGSSQSNGMLNVSLEMCTTVRVQKWIQPDSGWGYPSLRGSWRRSPRRQSWRRHTRPKQHRRWQRYHFNSYQIFFGRFKCFLFF